jgi:small neutral amino acid transporter SnatA (MarC family)
VSDFWLAALGIFAASAPLGLGPVFHSAAEGADGRERAGLASTAALVALSLLAAATAIGDPFVDWLDVSAESFQIAAGVVMIPQALRLLWSGESASAMANEGMRRWAWTLARTVPLLAGPPALVAALSYGTRFGVATTLGAAALTMAISAALLAGGGWGMRRARWLAPGLGRLNGGVLAVLAIEMVLDGVLSV